MKNKGFTLIELMVVVLIVGILAAAAIPLLLTRGDAAKWSEGRAGAGTIATALRSYCVEMQTFAATPTFTDIGIKTTDLDGTYFTHDAYAITSASCTNGVPSYTITVTAASSTRAGKPTVPATMTLTVTSGSAATWSQT